MIQIVQKSTEKLRKKKPSRIKFRNETVTVMIGKRGGERGKKNTDGVTRLSRTTRPAPHMPDTAAAVPPDGEEWVEDAVLGEAITGRGREASSSAIRELTFSCATFSF
jgi:hypothetical protein